MRVKRIGILETAAADPDRLALWEIFERRLHELGHAKGTDIGVEFRWADGRTERLAAAAAELVGLKVDVLVTAGTPAAAAASRATSDHSDRDGDRRRPRHAIDRRLRATQRQRHRHQRSAAGRQRKKTAIASRGGFRWRRSPFWRIAAIRRRRLALRETQAAAQLLGIAVKDYWIKAAGEFGAALAAMRGDGIAGFVVAPGGLFFAERKALAALAIEHRLASITARREYAEAGCLMAYGAPIRDNYLQAAGYVSQILRGAKPAELAMAEPATFDFVVNLKSAAALGLALPHSLLAPRRKDLVRHHRRAFAIDDLEHLQRDEQQQRDQPATVAQREQPSPLLYA